MGNKCCYPQVVRERDELRGKVVELTGLLEEERKGRVWDKKKATQAYLENVRKKKNQSLFILFRRKLRGL